MARNGGRLGPTANNAIFGMFSLQEQYQYRRDGMWGPLGSLENPATSGRQLFAAGLPSGDYWIKPTGYSGAAVQLSVNNDQLGGGWVLIGKGRQSNNNSGGWFGTENEVSVSGLLTANYLSAGVSKVSSSFVNYLMNGTATGWDNANANNYLIANRINNATDGYSGLSGSSKIKILNQSAFAWSNQFGGVGDAAPITGSGQWYGYSDLWLTGVNWWGTANGVINDSLDRGYTTENNDKRWFQWNWSSHGGNHGWSAGSGVTAGFQSGSEQHALQFIHLWAR